MVAVSVRDSLPLLKFRELHPVPGHIALVQALQGIKHHLAEGFPVIYREQFIGELLNILGGRHLAATDDGLHGLDQRPPIADTQWVRFGHGLGDTTVSLFSVARHKNNPPAPIFLNPSQREDI